MERIGILIVSYGSREAAMIDAFSRSLEYSVNLFVADKQRNPFNLKRAEKHVVIPSLDIDEICKFAKNNKDKIDFGIVGPEKPIIEGVRDLIEKETDIPMICPTKEYAIEGSKIAQRLLFQKIVPQANPEFKVFDPTEIGNRDRVKKMLYQWLDHLDNRVAIKPDAPAAGKGVGVWGDHFNTRQELYDHFTANFQEGSVIVEEKVEGEESSYQAFCDGRHLIPLPETRDYKRAFDDDKGPNTGGMGSYEDQTGFLPFMSFEDWEQERGIVEQIFETLKDGSHNPGLRGIPFYVAFIHTEKGPMILENNSRPGDPEFINIIPLLKDDFAEVCFKILEGTLNRIDIDNKASVVTYKVPPTYGGYAEVFPQEVDKMGAGTPVILDQAKQIESKFRDNIRFYPGSMELRNDGNIFPLSSRTIAVVGIGEDIQTAREISLEGVDKIQGGCLWNRTDIASERHIERSIRHMKQLRTTR